MNTIKTGLYRVAELCYKHERACVVVIFIVSISSMLLAATVGKTFTPGEFWLVMFVSLLSFVPLGSSLAFKFHLTMKRLFAADERV